MTVTPETRASLLMRVRNPRDHQAWQEFLAIYEPLILRVTRRYGLQEADGRELTQEVLLTVAGALDGWDPDPQKGSFRGWLSRVTRNLVLNFLTRQGRRGCGTGDSDMQRWLESQPVEGDAAELFDHEHRRQVFLWAAAEIRSDFAEHTWQAFWRTCVDDEPIALVARELNMTHGALYVARSRIMARLRKKVQERELH